MQTIIESLRDVVGTPNFYKVLSGSNPTWDYGSMFEYFFACTLLCIVVSAIFRILVGVFK